VLEDSVHPRLQLGASGHLLNSCVRSHDQTISSDRRRSSRARRGGLDSGASVSLTSHRLGHRIACSNEVLWHSERINGWRFNPIRLGRAAWDSYMVAAHELEHDT
jgi:hypothetical protein